MFRSLLRTWLHADVRMPRFAVLIVRGMHKGGVFVREALDAFYALVVVKPVMNAIADGGRRLRIERIPYIRGQGRIELGDEVYISGLLGVSFLKREGMVQTADRRPQTKDGRLKTDGTVTEDAEQSLQSAVCSLQSDVSSLPTLKIGSRTFIGHQCSFAMSSRIEIGDDCLIAAGTRIQDNDGHPLDPAARLRKEKVPLENIRPVRIGSNVWIAPNCTILKGVTIGDNAVIGAGSVVTKDVQAFELVAGVPARRLRSFR